MSQAIFRFYAELNDFLPLERRQVAFTSAFHGHPAIKDTVEALGVPHTEIDLILINGVSVDFSYPLADGDRVSVYPVFEGMDISPLVRLRPLPLRDPCFVLDGHLGRLATYLRLLGFDSLYRNDYDDPTLAAISAAEKRILLTRDRGLLKRSLVTHGYCLRSTDPRQQIKEVIQRFDLAGAAAPFTRCLHCNGRLAAVAKEDILDQLPANTRVYYQAFYRCAACRQIYWRGSHYRALEKLIAEIMTELKPPG